MSVVKDFAKLRDNKIHPETKWRLLTRIEDLIRFLNAPGDWGYGSKLAELTQILNVQRAALEKIPNEET